SRQEAVPAVHDHESRDAEAPGCGHGLMDARLAELLHLLELERLERDLFRGASRDIGAPQVFGGQVLGQALRAAYATVAASHAAHSLHAYFLKRGDFDAPIVYFVDRSRDGHSFSNRRVTAIQHGQQIFHMAASFQLPQEGLTHQLSMPAVPPPEALADGALPSRAELTVMPEKLREYYRSERPFEFRLIPPADEAGAAGAAGASAAGPSPSGADPLLQRVWMRTVDRLPDDDALHRCLLAYASDFHLLRTATLPHAAAFLSGRRFMASIDHAMWFHWPVRVGEGFLYA